MSVKLGIPSKGRLMEKTFNWFGRYGIRFAHQGSERTYAATVEGAALELVLLSASEIPRELAAGRIHLGVTGSDLVQEKLPNWTQLVETLVPMGFGHANLVIAVPDFWRDVQTLEDLDAVAADFRKAHGFRLRIATKYHVLVREFLRAEGVADYQLVDSQGATEGTVKNETAEAIADITSTGETLRANHLRSLTDGIIHRSEATLFQARRAVWTPQAQQELTHLKARLAL